MKILVGYDGSNVAKHAVQLVRDHAKAFDAEVHVLTSMVKANNNQYEYARQAELRLEYTITLLKEEGIGCETHLLVRGLSPKEDLVQYAVKNEIDEIFIGVQRQSKIGKVLMGSTAQHVILNAPLLHARWLR
ncbi:MAG: universal stress protein [Desulfobacterales bacterium]|jgi:nucleotide-binding universal stress UspA family protein